MRLLSVVIVVVLTATFCSGQLSIPSKELGFVFKNGSAGARVKLVTYLDFTCPDSKAVFPTLLQVADHYRPDQVQLRVHAFSLPYHRNSHTISKAAYFLNTYNCPKGNTVFDWIQIVYDNLEWLTTAATKDYTDNDVLDLLAKLAFNISGVEKSKFEAGVYNTDIDQTARLDWKYGCTRGVYGTPLYTVNDVFVNVDNNYPASKWIALIDDVLGK